MEEGRGKGGRRKGWRRGEGKGWKGKWHECIYTNAAIFMIAILSQLKLFIIKLVYIKVNKPP